MAKAKPKLKKKPGPPSSFTQEMADLICTRIAAGESLRSILAEPGMPVSSVVFKWLQNIPSFAEQYTRAREDQADTYADEIVRIADSEPDPNRARVRIDARKWVAGKLRPKVYGDKVGLEASGSLSVTIATGVSNDD